MVARLVSVTDTLELVRDVSYKLFIILYVFNFNCIAKSTRILLCFLPSSLLFFLLLNIVHVNRW